MTMQRGGMAPPRGAGAAAGARRLTTKDIKKYVNAEPWEFYDTQLFGAGTATPGPTGAPTTFNFAQFVSPLTFFGGRSVSNSGYPITNMNDSGKMEADFLADTITCSVWCDSKAPAAALVPTALTFVETIVNYCVLVLTFGSTTKLVLPVSHCPAGGGVYAPLGITQATDDELSYAGNGSPDARAAMPLSEKILFRRGSVFSMQLVCDTIATTGTAAKIVAIQALTGTFKAGIRIGIKGIKGSPLLEATPG